MARRKKLSGCQRRRRSRENLPKVAEVVFLADMGLSEEPPSEAQRRAVYPEIPDNNPTSSTPNCRIKLWDDSPY